MFLREGYVIFQCSTILKHISLNLYIITGLLLLQISITFNVIYGLFPEIYRY